MSANKRKLKRNIRPPKRYEEFVSTVSKRKGIEVESSSDEISKEDCMNKETSSIEMNIGGNDETGDFDASLEESNERNLDRNNEEVSNAAKEHNLEDLATQERISLSDS
ncbi:hypothetical protein Tco_1169064 [Tanacetum coccineum]